MTREIVVRIILNDEWETYNDTVDELVIEDIMLDISLSGISWEIVNNR